MAVLIFALSVGIALAQERVTAMLLLHTRQAKHWGGYILLLVGIWVILLAVFADIFAKLFPV